MLYTINISRAVLYLDEIFIWIEIYAFYFRDIIAFRRNLLGIAKVLIVECLV